MQLGKECRGIRIVQCGALANTQELHFKHIQQPDTHRCINVRQIAKDDVINRGHRGGNPLKPPMAGNLTWTRRINGSGRDQLAEGGDESVGALYLLPSSVMTQAAQHLRSLQYRNDNT